MFAKISNYLVLLHFAFGYMLNTEGVSSRFFYQLKKKHVLKSKATFDNDDMAIPQITSS